MKDGRRRGERVQGNKAWHGREKMKRAKETRREKENFTRSEITSERD